MLRSFDFQPSLDQVDNVPTLERVFAEAGRELVKVVQGHRADRGRHYR